jgi:hypothetical protein
MFRTAIFTLQSVCQFCIRFLFDFLNKKSSNNCKYIYKFVKTPF